MWPVAHNVVQGEEAHHPGSRRAKPTLTLSEKLNVTIVFFISMSLIALGVRAIQARSD